jgi:hypothetical protein
MPARPSGKSSLHSRKSAESEEDKAMGGGLCWYAAVEKKFVSYLFMYILYILDAF